MARDDGLKKEIGTRFFRLVSLSTLILFVFIAEIAGSARAIDAQAPPITQKTANVADSRVLAMLNQVQSTTLSTYVAQLSGSQVVTIGGSLVSLNSRSTTSASYSDLAAQYGYEHFQSLGLQVSYQTWQYFGGQRENVIAEQPGLSDDCIYLVSAHIDDTSEKQNTQAPGADDNASGVAGVFVVADILSQYEFKCTIRYALFSGEEQGLLGSDAYAHSAQTRGDAILGVLNLDMLAYNTPDSEAVIEMDTRSGVNQSKDQVLSSAVTNVILTYGIALSPVVYASNDDGSDHYSFWAHGFPAVLLIEDWADHTPYYHTTNDTLSTLNMAYYSAYVKAIVGTLAQLSQPVEKSFIPFVSR